MKSTLFRLITTALILGITLPSQARIVSTSPSAAAIHVIDHRLPLRPPQPIWGGKPDFSQVMAYYRKLNQAIVQRNPVVDAKNSLARGRIEFMDTSIALTGSVGEQLRHKYGNTLKRVFKDPRTPLPLKSIQATSFQADALLLDSRTYPRPRKVLEIYAQSALRYAVFWNRTVDHYLAQQEKAKQRKEKRQVKHKEDCKEK